MKSVNLYIDTSIHGPRRTKGAYGYVLETMTAAGPATFSKIKALEETTERQSLCLAILDALGHMRQQCYLTVYTQSPYIRSVLEKWLNEWKYNGWQSKKGTIVTDADSWKQVAEKLNGMPVRVEMDSWHQYKQWLQTETIGKVRE